MRVEREGRGGETALQYGGKEKIGGKSTGKTHMIMFSHKIYMGIQAVGVFVDAAVSSIKVFQERISFSDSPVYASLEA